ncbi:fibrinogen and fibronectin [Elysia marginata]|uniref:Fibrinogen and fibronectin n=1 Tax=Elysia marginata TaxID=1093978 RepID=A0AAV4GGC9_9GAST|nr:fibrinogen and fibronectin [Elysia marginata]
MNESLRRINGDVYFNRDWDSFKDGFGKPEPDEDFWLGNEAVHILTYVQPYELRVELASDGKDYVALYKTFKLEN